MSSYRTALCNSPSSCLHSPAVASDWIFDTTSYVMIPPIASTGTKPVPSSTWISWRRSSEPPMWQRWNGGFPLQFRSFALSKPIVLPRKAMRIRSVLELPDTWKSNSTSIHIDFLSQRCSWWSWNSWNLNSKKHTPKLEDESEYKSLLVASFPGKSTNSYKFLFFQGNLAGPKRGDATLPKCNGLA